MAKVIIKPISKMTTSGSSTLFKVRVEGSDASTIRVLPCKDAEGYRAQLAGGWIVPTFITAVVVALVIIIVSGAFASAWIRILLIVLGAMVGLIGAASIGFALWGKYLGFPWHFTFDFANSQTTTKKRSANEQEELYRRRSKKHW